jgi:hypothetical protein
MTTSFLYREISLACSGVRDVPSDATAESKPA